MATKGFVFDFDGLILDTEVPHFKAWQETFKHFGCSLSLEKWEQLIGTSWAAYDPADDLVEQTNGRAERGFIKKMARELSFVFIDQETLRPGVEAFLQAASERGLKLAVASSSDSDWVNPFLEKFALTHYFEAVYTGSDVKMVKPDPELYNLAVTHFGYPANEVIAFEDSLNGVKAAKAAGLYCIAVPNLVTRGMDLSIADRIVDSFEALSLDELIELQR
jgi:haloacid dehalogenase superfamily, subfamily IA, variant 3 with third motif having DD or ED